jgi:cytochrome P450
MLGETYAGSARKIARDSASPGCPAHAGADGLWHVQDYAGARTALRSGGTRQAGFAAENADKLPRKMRLPVLWRDGPSHREHRRQVARFFTPRRVETTYRALMESFAGEQIALLQRKRRADLTRLSFDLSVAVTGEVVGLTNSNRRGMARRLERFFMEGRTKPGTNSPAALAALLYSNTSLAAFYLADVRPAIRARTKERHLRRVRHLRRRRHDHHQGIHHHRRLAPVHRPGAAS